MKQTRTTIATSLIAALIILPMFLLNGHGVSALTEKSGSVGLQGSVGASPPSTAATITTPSNGQTVTSNPVRVSGLCPGDVLVKIFKNGVFAGSAQCANGSYSLQIDLFSGSNELIAKITDSLDQSGPDSSPVSVTYKDAQYGNVGKRISITSNYSKRGANPGANLTWSVTISGGTGPYAISVDWGDGKPVDLKSQELAGSADLNHTYSDAGVYNIIIKATDKNGDAAFLQVVGIANGAISKTANGSSVTDKALAACKVVPWWLDIVVLIIVAIFSFWLGGRFALLNLRRRLAGQSDQNE